MKYYLTAYKEEDLSTKVKFRNIDRDSIFRSIVFTYKQLLKDYPNLNMPFSLINNLATITYRAGCMTNDTELMKESCFFLNLGLNKCHNPTEQEIGVFNLYKMLKMVRFFPSSLYEQTCVNYKTLRLDNDLKVETISENNFRIRAQYLDKEVNIQFYVDLILTKDLIPKFLIHKI